MYKYKRIKCHITTSPFQMVKQFRSITWHFNFIVPVGHIKIFLIKYNKNSIKFNQVMTDNKSEQ